MHERLRPRGKDVLHALRGNLEVAVGTQLRHQTVELR